MTMINYDQNYWKQLVIENLCIDPRYATMTKREVKKCIKIIMKDNYNWLDLKSAIYYYVDEVIEERNKKNGS